MNDNETSNPKFTQRHYEYLAQALTRLNPSDTKLEIIEFLSKEFKNDNPKFNPHKFLAKSLAQS